MLASDAHFQRGATITPDTFQRYLNEGGLYAELIGVHLLGSPETWSRGTSLTGGGVFLAGTNFCRTTFNLVRVLRPTGEGLVLNYQFIMINLESRRHYCHFGLSIMPERLSLFSSCFLIACSPPPSTLKTMPSPTCEA